MVDQKIKMNVNETLELDYLVEEVSRDIITIDKNPNGLSDDYISKEKYIFNPSGAGIYQISLKNQVIEIEVTDIPDSTIYRWKLDDVATGTATDSVGTADGTVDGVSSVSNLWQEGSAGDGDGQDDYIDLNSTLPDFQSNITSGYTIATTVQTTATSEINAFGSGNGSFNDIFALRLNRAGVTDDWQVEYQSSDQSFRYGANFDWSDGAKHRVVSRFDSSNTGDNRVEIYDNTSAQSAAVEKEDSLDSPSITSNFYMFARNSAGSPTSYFDGILDDFIIYNKPLTIQEIQDDYNLQPWT
jgi:hypothetical protein